MMQVLYKNQQFDLLTMHGPDALKALEIPQLDSHVCRAGRKQFASLVK